MRSCPDPDVLATLAASVAWDEEALQHLVGCEACRDTRAVLRATREALIAQEALPSGFADRVLQSLPVTTEERAVSGLGATLLLSLTVGLTAFFALLVSSGPVPVRIGPALSAAAALGLAAALREWRLRQQGHA